MGVVCLEEFVVSGEKRDYEKFFFYVGVDDGIFFCVCKLF